MKRVCLVLSSFSRLMGEPLTLTVDPDNSTITSYKTLSGEAVTQNTATGTIELDLTLDPVTRRPTAVTFTGGTLFYSDFNSVYTPNATPAVENLTINSANNSGKLDTVTPNSPIAPLTGALTNEDHTTSLTAGTLFVEYQLIFFGTPSTLFSSTTDFAAEPQVSSFFGQNTITSSLFNSSPLEETYQITLTTTADPDPSDLSDQGLELTISSEGGFSAHGFIVRPSAAFTAWSASHQPTANPPEIFYALGFPPGESQLPLAIRPGEITLSLPETGSLVPVMIQYSTDLQIWTPIQTIPANSTGEFIAPVAPSSSGFVRLVVE